MLSNKDKKRCASMLNDLSLAYYTGDERYKKHVDMQISLYEVLSLTTEAMAVMIAFNTFKNDI